MGKVTTYTEYTRSCIKSARKDLMVAANCLNSGLIHVKTIDDVHQLIKGGYPYIYLTGIGAHDGDNVDLQEGVDDLTVVFQNNHTSVNVLCDYEDLYKVVQFVAR